MRDPVPDHISVYEAVRDRKPKRAEQAMARLIDLALRDTTQAREIRRSRRNVVSSSPPPTRRVQE
jgi:DNA-binding FadR family transcriptional regulator